MKTYCGDLYCVMLGCSRYEQCEHSNIQGSESDSDVSITIKKMHLIKKLLTEVESEVNETAEQIKTLDIPLYRMLTEGIASYFRYQAKYYGRDLDARQKQISYAHKLIKANK